MKPSKPCRRCGGTGKVKGRKALVPCPVCQGNRKGYATK